MNLIIEYEKKIKLRNGKDITPDDQDHFEAMQDIDTECEHPCKICPIFEVCEGNNQFDCLVYGMFDGGNFYLTDLIKVCDEARKYREIKNG